jgi:uncharacterized protein DUF5666
MRRIILMLVAGVLTAAIALPAFAASPAPTATPTAKAHSHWFAGSVSAVGSSSLTVGVLWTGPHDSTLNGQSVTVSVDSNTEIVSGKDKTPVPLSSIQNGDLVGVVASGSDLSSMTALRVHVFCNCHWIGGTISSLDSSSLTVQVKKTGPYDTVLAGQAVTIGVDGKTTYILGKDKTPIQFSDLKVGEGVGVIFSANGFFKAPGFDPSKAIFTAKQVHVWGHRQVPVASTDASKAAQVTP